MSRTAKAIETVCLTVDMWHNDGGDWGDPINGAINVTVLDALSSAPIPDATVLAVPSDAAGPGAVPLVALTDANGQAVVSAKTLQPTQNVTAAAPSYEVATVEKVARALGVTMGELLD